MADDQADLAEGQATPPLGSAPPSEGETAERVSFLSLAQDPKLAEAARAEVHRQQSNEHLDHDAGHLPDHHLDVPPPDSTTVLQGLHSLILSEYHLNKSLADGLGVRLEASKTSIEKLLALLQAVTTAESAYAQAMSKAALVDVRSADDGEGLQSAVGGFGHLLGLIGQAHTQVYEGLSEATKSVQASVGALRSSCNAIQSSHASAARGVEEAQGRIRQAKQAHSDAVNGISATNRAVAAAHLPMPAQRLSKALERFATNVGAISGAADPWACEAALVDAYAALGSACEAQRVVLLENVARLKNVEVQRVALIKTGLNSFLGQYKDVLLTMMGEVGKMGSLASAIDVHAEMASIENAMQHTQQAGQAFAAKRHEAVEAAQQELLCSPEIIKQGGLARSTINGEWEECHCVLTKAGRLHWFADASSVGKEGGHAVLSRCQFEEGDAPAFYLMESGLPIAKTLAVLGGAPKQRRLGFKAASVEECCEWAIALREVIGGGGGGGS